MANRATTEVLALPGTNYWADALRGLAASASDGNVVRSLPDDVPPAIAADVVDWLAGELFARGVEAVGALHAVADALRDAPWRPRSELDRQAR